jgi:amidase
MKDTVIWNIEQGQRLTGAQVGAAEVKRTQLFHRMREFMEKYDFLVAPAVQVLPFDVEIPTRHGSTVTKWAIISTGCVRVTTITVTGAPALCLPGGFSHGGLPVGLQIVGRHQDDFGVLQIATRPSERSAGYGKQKPVIARNNP